MKYSEMDDIQKKSTEELGVHLRDCLGTLNVPFKNGAASKEDWEKILDTFNPLWKNYEERFGLSVDEASRNYIKRILAT